MIIDASQKDLLPPAFAMVDGCFDPIHRGHVEYFEIAHRLGVPVMCNAASDAYILGHKKRSPLLPQRDRLVVLDAIRYISFTVAADHGTAWSLRHFRPRYYVKGSDWRDRLPPEQVTICSELGIEIVYADCPRDSSTRILQVFMENRHANQAV